VKPSQLGLIGGPVPFTDRFVDVAGVDGAPAAHRDAVQVPAPGDPGRRTPAPATAGPRESVQRGITHPGTQVPSASWPFVTAAR